MNIKKALETLNKIKSDKWKDHYLTLQDMEQILQSLGKPEEETYSLCSKHQIPDINCELCKRKYEIWTQEEVFEHIRLNVKDYSAAIVVAALYKRIYGEFPKIGLSGSQAECADSIIPKLP